MTDISPIFFVLLLVLVLLLLGVDVGIGVAGDSVGVAVGCGCFLTSTVVANTLAHTPTLTRSLYL